MLNVEIERSYLVDLDVTYDSATETIDNAIAELTAGLLVQGSLLIVPGPGGWPVVRFTGPRNQLEELINRYSGVVGVFKSSVYNPDGVTLDAASR